MDINIPPLDDSSFYNVINNELVRTQLTRHSVNPATGRPNPDVPVCTREDLDLAVSAARSAFKLWSKTPIQERRAALHAYADAVAAQHDFFTRLLTQEQGKPLAQAGVEIDMAVAWLKEIPAVALPETVLREDDQQKIIQRYVPMGVAAGIVPWNFPVLLAVGKIASAIYTGNAIIVKPSPFTPYCTLKLGELATKIFPPGLLQVLSGDENLGPWITAHAGINKISFTGSIETGKRVMASSATTLKRVTLELGGNDPAIICENVDISDVVPKVALLSFLASSQVCMMIKRLYVHEKIYDEFLDAFVNHTAKLKVGCGTDPDTFFGPVQNSMQYNKLKDLLTSIQSEGLTAVLGGTIDDSREGFYVPPTIIDNPPDGSRVVQEEPFGPIIPLLKWSDEKDVINRANNSDTGLGASVWAKDLALANRIASELEAGSVWVNSHFDVSPKVPFGGQKMSGIGSELGLAGLVSYCNTQCLWLKK